MVTMKEKKAQIIKEFGMSAQDTGSSAVQVALLTDAIKSLTEHCQRFPKDVSTKRGLLKKVCERRKFIAYLERHDGKKHQEILNRLGLKK
jgi:small subunit ribosomal protein S15